MSNVLKLKTSAIRIVPHRTERRREPFPQLDTILIEEEEPVLLAEKEDQLAEQGHDGEKGSSQPQWQDMTAVVAAAQKESYEQGYAQAMKDCEKQYAIRLQEDCQRAIKPQYEQMNQVITASTKCMEINLAPA